MVSDESPVDGGTGVSVGISQLSVLIEDLEGDLIDWSIETYPDIGSSPGVFRDVDDKDFLHIR